MIVEDAADEFQNVQDIVLSGQLLNFFRSNGRNIPQQIDTEAQVKWMQLAVNDVKAISESLKITVATTYRLNDLVTFAKLNALRPEL